MRISAIAFDGDMTLWDFHKVMRHSLKHALVELRRTAPTELASRLTVDEMIDIREQVAEELRGKVWNLSEIRRIAKEFPNDEMMQEIHFIRQVHYLQTKVSSLEERLRFFEASNQKASG